MTTTTRNKSKLRQTLQHEDVSVAARLAAATPEAEPATNAGTQTPPAPLETSPGPDAETTATAAPDATAATPTTPAPAHKPASRRARAPKAGGGATAVRARPAPPAAAIVEALPKRQKPVRQEKVERDSFSIPVNEHKRIKALREALGKRGVLASKSEVLRAGLALLASRQAEEVAELVGALPKVVKGKRKKH